ncbi:MAG: thiol reductant ABC exporter subunit CydD [Anaerolineales bacterium]|jgi:ATP-binding cassette subfamily C protein CydD
MNSTTSLKNRRASALKLDPRLLSLAAVAKTDLALTIGLSAAAGLLVVGFAWQLTTIIDLVFLHGAGLQQVLPQLMMAVLFALGRAGSTWGVEIFASRLALAIKHALRRELIHKLFLLGPAYQRRQQRGELVNTLVAGIEQLEAYFSQFLPSAALAVLVPITLLTLIAVRDPLSALILLLTAPLIPLFMILIGSAADRLTQRQWTQLSRMSAVFYDLLQGLKTLKALGRSREQSQRIQQASQAYNHATIQVLQLAFTSALALEWLSTLSTAVIAVEIGLRLLAGNIQFQPALFILVLAPEYYLPLRTLGIRFHAAMDGLAAAARIFSILEIPVESQAGLAPPPISAPSIRLKEIRFQHTDRSHGGLRDISLTILPGQPTALLGPTGAGKSTLLDLLLGFYQPEGGSLWINDLDLVTLDPSLWRQMIAWIPQNPYVFNATLRHNLLQARPDASRTDLIEALAFAGLDDIWRRWPQGLDRHLGSEGVRLSAGQAARLALARAYLHDAPVVLMDEPTAHLDPSSEEIIINRLKPWLHSRTAVIATHRMSLAKICSQIVVINQGKVVQSGPQSRLVETAGPYRDLMRIYREGV